MKLSKASFKRGFKKFSSLFSIPTLMLASVFAPVAKAKTQNLDAAQYKIEFGSHRSPRYNSMFTWSGTNRYKAYKERMFWVKINNQTAYCIEPFVWMPNVSTRTGTATSLEEAVRQSEHNTNNPAAAAKRMSLFAYYTQNPTPAIRSVMNANSISNTDIQVATQYYIWEVLGFKFEDGKHGAYDPNGTGLDQVYDTKEHMVWVDTSTPGTPGSSSYTATIVKRTPSDLKASVIGKPEVSGNQISISYMMGDSDGSYDPVAGTQTFNSPPAAGETKQYSISDSWGTIVVEVKHNRTPGTPGQTSGYWKAVKETHKVDVFSIPTWYRNLKAAVEKEVNFQMNLQAPKFTPTKETVVVGNVAEYRRTSGSSLKDFFRDSNIPTSRPSKPNYQGHTYVWYTGETLKVEPTMQSPDDFYPIELVSHSAPNTSKKDVGYVFDRNTQNLVSLSGSHGSVKAQVQVKVLKTGDIEILKKNKDTGEVVPGTKFEVYEDAAGTKKVTDIKGRKIFETNSKGKTKVEGLRVNLSGNKTYYVKEVFVPEPLVLDDKLYPVVVNAGKVSYYDALNKEQLGVININKLDGETGLLLEDPMFDGAKFKVTLVEPYTKLGKKGTSYDLTIKGGKAKTPAIPLGKYDIEEIEAPFGFNLAKTSVELTAKYSNMTVEINQEFKDFDNERQLGFIEFNKQDVETGTTAQGDGTLAGAEYELRLVKYELPAKYIPNAKKPGDVIAKFVTDQNGYAKVENLELGEYEIVEVKPSEGYMLNPKRVRVKLDYAGQNAGVSDKVTQKNQNHEELIKELNDLQTEVNDMITNKTQLIDRKPTPMLDPNKVDNSRVTTLNERAIMGRIELNKTATDTQDIPGSAIDQPEVGAVFEVIHKASGKVVDTMVTNSRGYATTKYLPYGKYIVKQVKGSEGYWLTDPFEVMIDRDSHAYYYSLRNQEIVTKLKIVKTDSETGKQIPIAGVSFELYEQAEGGKPIVQNDFYPSNEQISLFKTDENGEFVFPEYLPYGTYYLEEVDAPEGYYLDPEAPRIPVVLKGEYTVVETLMWSELVPNIPQKGQIELEKMGDVFKGIKEVSYNDKVEEALALAESDFAETLYEPVFEHGYLGGAVFEIRAAEDIVGKEGTVHYKKGDLVETLTTNFDGPIKSEEMPLGKYTLQEVKAPEGYMLDDTVHEFEFKPMEQHIRVKIESHAQENIKQNANFKFGKFIEESDYFGYEDDAHEQIVFGLYAQEDIKFQGHTVPKGTLLGLSTIERLFQEDPEVADGGESFYRGELGTVLAGKYVLREVSTKIEYELDDEKVVEFNYDPVGENTVEIEVEDEFVNNLKRFRLDIVKANEEGDKLSGAQFALSALPEGKDPISIGTDTTGEDGIASFGELEAGHYMIEEILYPAGHRPKDGNRVHIVHLDPTNPYERLEVEVENVQTRAAFAKVDSETQELLAGAVLQVLDLDGNVIDEWITEEALHEVVGELNVGQEYILREVHNPDGYATAEDIHFVMEDREVVYVTMHDQPTTVEFSKVDIMGGEELPGAHLRLTDAEGNTIEEWISSEQPHIIKGLVTGKRYILIEDLAPLGYHIANEVEFVVEDTANIQTVVMEDEPTVTKISKVDVMTGEELPGAHLSILDEEGNVVEEWISSDEPHYVYRLHVGKTYTLREDTAPLGYHLTNEVEFTIAEDGSVNSVVLENVPTETHISKKDATTGEELPGAHLSLYDEEGNLVEEWISSEEPHKIYGLHIGKKYTLREDLAPIGYATASEVEFVIKDDGTVNEVEMIDEPTKVYISKKDIVTKEELPGAKLQIFDEDGNIVHEWISTDEPHYIEKLPVGKYTLREITAPDGYLVAEDVEFEITEEEIIHHVEMFDKPTRVYISKKDIVNGEELPGAKLQVIDKDGNVIEEWISTDKPHYIERLPIGHYILREITAPYGYEIAEDVEFEITDEDIIHHVEMFDSPIPEPEVPTTPTGVEGVYGNGGKVAAISGVALGLGALAIALRKKDEE